MSSFYLAFEEQIHNNDWEQKMSHASPAYSDPPVA